MRNVILEKRLKNVILTGGSGFIGGHVINDLISRGIHVTVLTSKVNFYNNNSLVDIIYTSYDYNDIIKKVHGKKYDVFYHLGWGGVNGTDKNNIQKQISNIQTTIDMLKLSKELDCSVFIAAGTVAEYVFCEGVIDFSKKQTPNDMYGATKVAVHYLLEAAAKEIEQNIIWVILPSTFGEGRSGENILTYTIMSLLRGECPEYGELNQMWDFLYVTEVARALVDIGKRGKMNTTYGIGSGEYRPLREYINIIRNKINPDLPLGIGRKKLIKKETFSSCVNIESLTKDTGFVPRISFEEGITKTIEYYKKVLGM